MKNRMLLIVWMIALPIELHAQPRGADIYLIREYMTLGLNPDDSSSSWNMDLYNFGDTTLNFWISEPQVDWLSVEPLEGTIQRGDGSRITFRTADIPEVGEHRTELIITSNDPDERELTFPVFLIVAAEGERVQIIRLNSGWNFVSWNLYPSEQFRENDIPSVRLILEDVIDRVVIVKVMDGRFSIPWMGFWGIREWESGLGYQIRLTAACDLVVTGEPIPADRPIQLRAGWNSIAYYPNRMLRAETSFASLIENGNLICLKNGRGEFWRPRLVYGMFITRPGEAYMVQVRNAVDFRYSE
jgi:hypothetical protein